MYAAVIVCLTELATSYLIGRRGKICDCIILCLLILTDSECIVSCSLKCLCILSHNGLTDFVPTLARSN